MHTSFRASPKRPQMPLGSAKVLGLVALLAFLCACQKSSQEHLAEARSNLASASHDQAIQSGLIRYANSPNILSIAIGRRVVRMKIPSARRLSFSLDAR